PFSTFAECVIPDAYQKRILFQTFQWFDGLTMSGFILNRFAPFNALRQFKVQGSRVQGELPRFENSRNVESLLNETRLRLAQSLRQKLLCKDDLISGLYFWYFRKRRETRYQNPQCPDPRQLRV